MTKTFFVRQSRLDREAKYRLIFDLAWDDKGMIVNLDELPDDILQLFLRWRNERVEEENAKVK